MKDSNSYRPFIIDDVSRLSQSIADVYLAQSTDSKVSSSATPQHNGPLPTAQFTDLTDLAGLSKTLLDQFIMASKGEINPFILLIHLNLKTKTKLNRLNFNGIPFYEALLARMPLIDAAGVAKPLPVLFYTIESLKGVKLSQQGSQFVEAHILEKLPLAVGRNRKDIIWSISDEPSGLIERIHSALNFWSTCFQRQKTFLRYIAGVCQRETEQVNATIRHAFSPSRRPAVRVLLGALQAGDVKWNQCKQLLTALRASEPQLNTLNADYSIGQLSYFMVDNYLKTSKRSQQPHATLHNLNYLLVDDLASNSEYVYVDGSVRSIQPTGQQTLEIPPEDNGWGATIACITRSHVICVKNGKDVDSLVAPHTGTSSAGLNWDAVFMDYDLQHAENGGYYLRLIKSRQFDLPVVMFTGMDDSGIAKWCLSYGAAAYFVKETTEIESRKSLDSYQNLRSILRSLPRYSDQKRTLWRRFTKIEDKIEYLEDEVWDQCYKPLGGFSFTSDGPPISWNIRQAFYWLFKSNQTLDKEGIPSIVGSKNDGEWLEASYEDECALAISLHSQNAFEMLLASHWLKKLRKGTVEDWLAYRRKPPKGLYNKIRRVVEKSVAKRFRISKLRTREKDSHLFQPALPDSVACLEEVITNFEVYFSEPGFGNVRLQKRRSLLMNGPASVNGSDVQRNHAELAKMGAQEFVCGWADIVCPTLSASLLDQWAKSRSQAVQNVSVALDDLAVLTQDYGLEWHSGFYNKYKLLLIDDDPINTGWEDALKIVCGINSVLTLLPSALEREDGMNLSGVDVVLLDLRMPSPIDGIKTLDRICRLYPAVPIVMLTASDQAYWTHLALRKGAANYFLKHSVNHIPGRSVRSFVEMIKALADSFGHTTISRRIWEEIANTKKLVPLTIPQDLYLKKHLGIVPPPKIARQQSLRASWLNGLIWQRIDEIYECYLKSISYSFDPNQRIDVYHWLIEGLHNPKYRNSRPMEPPYSILLALRCGQLVELLSLITMSKMFPQESNEFTPPEIIRKALPDLPTLPSGLGLYDQARAIYKERERSAHGFLLAHSGTSLTSSTAATDPSKAALNTILCVKSWLGLLGWS